MYQYKFISSSTINVVLNQKLPSDISNEIILKLREYICNWNKSIILDIYVSSSKIEFDRINILFQTKKYFGGRKTAKIESNCSINDNTMITYFIDEMNCSIEINILSQK